ncbi:carbohydrate ABC transporter permease [Deinococcus aerophilus]|uniref:Sugar ABC transporter permease n=1 Tax=Deinococcus aerophilus TaxID=522488 RepID=A0ABQ2GWC1_9DEIO|nr:sugar ABC transporter permease [Deinococcus aerophilus]GGM14698.1 sugar ABC transporter permease [Deinococcus aerophilus]
MSQKTTVRPVDARPGRDRVRRETSEARLAFWLLLPAALLLCGVLLFPMLTTFRDSFFFNKLTEPYNGQPFVGLKNYVQMFGDPRFGQAMRNTLFFAILTVGGSFLVGIPMALAAHTPSRIRGLARVALLLPWAMPPVMTGLIFAWLFNAQYGVFNDFLVRLGIVQEPLRWLSTPGLAVLAMVVTIVWKTSSFVALIVLGGLQGIPRELTEASEVDGATRVQSFFRVILPLLAPSLAVAFIFRAISAVQVFDIPYTFIQQAPAQGLLETLGVYIYRTSIEFLDFGYAATLSVALFAVSLAVTAVYVRFVRDGAST